MSTPSLALRSHQIHRCRHVASSRHSTLPCYFCHPWHFCLTHLLLYKSLKSSLSFMCWALPLHKLESSLESPTVSETAWIRGFKDLNHNNKTPGDLWRVPVTLGIRVGRNVTAELTVFHLRSQEKHGHSQWNLVVTALTHVHLGFRNIPGTPAWLFEVDKWKWMHRMHCIRYIYLLHKMHFASIIPWLHN